MDAYRALNDLGYAHQGEAGPKIKRQDFVDRMIKAGVASDDATLLWDAMKYDSPSKANDEEWGGFVLGVCAVYGLLGRAKE